MSCSSIHLPDRGTPAREASRICRAPSLDDCFLPRPGRPVGVGAGRPGSTVPRTGCPRRRCGRRRSIAHCQSPAGSSNRCRLKGMRLPSFLMQCAMAHHPPSRLGLAACHSGRMASTMKAQLFDAGRLLSSESGSPALHCKPDRRRGSGRTRRCPSRLVPVEPPASHMPPRAPPKASPASPSDLREQRGKGGIAASPRVSLGWPSGRYWLLARPVGPPWWVVHLFPQSDGSAFSGLSIIGMAVWGKQERVPRGSREGGGGPSMSSWSCGLDLLSSVPLAENIDWLPVPPTSLSFYRGDAKPRGTLSPSSRPRVRRPNAVGRWPSRT
jgi:hypothetical protein